MLGIPPGPRLSIRRSIFIIFLSIFGVFGSALSLLYGYRFLELLHAESDHYTIKAVAQSCPEYEALPTSFFAEILGLSSDQKINLYHFNVEHAQKRLLATHVIQKASIETVKPHTLLIDYTIRHPVAYIGDFANTAIDEEGELFPATPYHTPKTLPEIYFGDKSYSEDEQIWGTKIDPERVALALDLLSLFEPKELIRADLSHLDEPSLGKRELLLLLKDQTLLRLTPKRYHRELANYRALSETLLPKESKPTTIDLRVPQVAYLQEPIHK
ncbi:MAG: Cell division protein FtsQ [Chlamydiae bacterium]|nr:Cell division protein FtsQ [Chlamydiota bacterium]